MNICPILPVAAFLVAGAAFAQEDTKVVTLTDVPAPIQKAIQAQLNGSTIIEIDQVQAEGEVTYDVEVGTKDGGHGGFTLGADGKMQRLEIALADAPAIVQKTIKAQMGADTLLSISKALDDGGMIYDVAVTMKDGQSRDFSVAADGKLSNEEVFLADLPAVVQKTITAQVRQGTLDNIEESFDDDHIIYLAQMTTKAGEERHFSVGPEGKLESQQISPTAAPAVVQTAITTQLDGGKVISVEKNFAEDGVSYEVEMLNQAGEKRNFSLGADGKLESQQLALTEAPAAVQATIKGLLYGGKVSYIEKNTADDAVIYEVEITTKDGASRDCTIAADGKLETLQMFLFETPADVQKTIRAQLGKNTLDRIEKNIDVDGTTYEVEMKIADGSTRNFVVAPSGALESLQVTLPEIPLVAQKTISAQIALGKLESIEKITDEDGVTYDVVMTTKAGKTKSFSVTADGTLEK
jgi:uncharacterized membrane protein YkoI